ncbi:MAG: phosphoglucosamine mutase [Coriobacteriales bacterium]|nr:phosphoglucosamine mutase [Coriobacteriales bacterium]
MTRYFGTDGIRGVAGTQLTYDMAFALGQIAVEVLGPIQVIGRDTRRSGAAFERALTAGITHAGGEALLAGVIPTPAVALLVRELAASGGVVISASHNPPEYNGIKFFDAQGFKLTTALEDAFEERLQAILDSASPLSFLEHSDENDTGTPIPNAAARYVAYAAATVTQQGIDLTGLKVAVDCGHGASFETTPQALRALGAEVVAINTTYNGDDINVDCGSTHLGPLKELVARTGAAVGLAHDGDADRLIAVDAAGNERDGDFIEAVCAVDLQARGLLKKQTVVSTVAGNLGFVRAMKEHGIDVVQTSVGDSNVLEAMRAGGYNLGGEQSGHTIFLDHNSTGDGLVSALQLLAAMKRSGKPLARLAQVMTRYPQVLINVKVADKTAALASAALNAAIDAAQIHLQDNGRVLVRPSGTEPLVRVMVEAPSEELAQELAQRIADEL